VNGYPSPFDCALLAPTPCASTPCASVTACNVEPSTKHAERGVDDVNFRFDSEVLR